MLVARVGKRLDAQIDRVNLNLVERLRPDWSVIAESFGGRIGCTKALRLHPARTSLLALNLDTPAPSRVLDREPLRTSDGTNSNGADICSTASHHKEKAESQRPSKHDQDRPPN